MSDGFTPSQRASLTVPQTGVLPVFAKQRFNIGDTNAGSSTLQLNFPRRPGSAVLVFASTAATPIWHYLVEGVHFRVVGASRIELSDATTDGDYYEVSYTY